MKHVKQAIRGTGYLPHVGAHPGTEIVILLILLTAFVSAAHAGVLGFIAGFFFSAVIYGPIYLIGAYDRARLSDRLQKGEPG